MNLGQFIKSKRISLGMSQEDLAKEINKHKAFISRIETGHVRTLKHDYIRILAKALKVSPILFFEGFDSNGDLIENNIEKNDFEKIAFSWVTDNNISQEEKKLFLDNLYNMMRDEEK